MLIWRFCNTSRTLQLLCIYYYFFISKGLMLDNIDKEISFSKINKVINQFEKYWLF